jgi:LysM repeat protein
VALVVGLFFTLSWALGVGGPFGSSPPAATASPSPAVSQLPPPKTVGEVVPSPSPSPSPEASPPPPATTGRVHVVQAGDTLNRISQQYGVTVDGIMQANGFTDRNRILRIGERLVIPDSPPASPAPVPR